MEKIEELENKVINLEKIVSDLQVKISILENKDLTTPNINNLKKEGFANVHAYKNSIILVSLSKDQGTYLIKDEIKKIGGKWSNLIDKNGNKFTGWVFVGVCKDKPLENSLLEIIEQLEKEKCKLKYTIMDPIEAPN